MGNIEYFRSNDIQAYTPPAAPRKAAETAQAPAAAPKEETLALGDLQKYDVDGNGKITKDEFNATRGGELLAAKAAQEQELFKKLDANGDGKLSSDEFLRAFSQLTGDANVAKVRDHVDGEFNPRKDADGTIHVAPKVQAGGGTTPPQPAAKAEPKPEPKTEKPTTKEVTVQAGDTLGKIAKANGVTLAELKEANPDLFKAGTDSTGKRRTAGGDLIYPGDKVKLPVKAEPKAGGGDKPAALDDQAAVKYLQDNFDKVASGDGSVSRTDLAAKLPEGPGKEALLKHFDSLMFASVDQGKEAWSNLTKADVEQIGKKLTGAGSIEKLAGELTQQVIKDREIKDQTGDGKVDAQDLAAFVKANGGDAPLDATQAKLLGSLNERITSLQAELDKTTKDLKDPAKQAEAMARIHLLNMQISTLAGIQTHVAAYRPAANLSAEDGKKIQDVFGKIEQLTKDLSNPTKAGEVQAGLTLAYNFLENPKLYDPKAPKGTTDPTLLSQASAAQNFSDRITKLLGEMNALIPDLANPARMAEADARLKQLDAQVRTQIDHSWKVKNYRRPANLSADQAKQASDLLTQIDGQVALLGNPLKKAEAEAQLKELYGKLEKIGK